MRAFNKNTGLGMSSAYADMLRVYADNAEKQRLNAQGRDALEREKAFNAQQLIESRAFQDELDSMSPPTIGGAGGATGAVGSGAKRGMAASGNPNSMGSNEHLVRSSSKKPRTKTQICTMGSDGREDCRNDFSGVYEKLNAPASTLVGALVTDSHNSRLL